MDGAGGWWLEQDGEQTNPREMRYPCAALNISGDGGLHSELVFIFGRIFVFLLFVSLG